jgi:hypothetical protein
MAQNAEEEGRGVEQQNLDRKLNVEWDTERIAGTAETAWEKATAGEKTETANQTTMAQSEKRMAETRKRAVNMWKIVKGTRKTAMVNKKTEGESLYQNRCNTHQTDSRMILYTLKKKELNREQEQELVY